MENTWVSLLPPLIVLVTAFISKKIVPSLIIGIISASLIVNDFVLSKSSIAIFNELLDQFTDFQNYLFFGLLYSLGIIICLIEKTGGAQALGEIITKRANTKKAVETSCLSLSMLLFIDDYLNVLTVGNVMRKVTDKLHIARVKLAYLAATMSAALVMIVPVSTWIGFIIGQLNAAGISLETSSNTLILTDPFFIYLSFIPFIFYSIMIIVSNWIIVRTKLSFGPMHEAEKIASQTGNVFGGKKAHKAELTIEKDKSVSILDFLLPISTFILLILIGIPYTGGYYLLGGNNSLNIAFQKSNAPLVLLSASIISLLVSIFFALTRKKINVTDIPNIIKHGIKLMNAAILMILFAWIFGSFIKLLKTGQFIANLLLGSISINFIPFMIFICSLIVTLSIGSTWGTIAIMAPLVTTICPAMLKITNFPITIDEIFILIPSLGAIFSGALAGNHLSPISDSTIMSVASTGAYLIDLVKARFLYVLCPIIATGCAYIITGLLINQNKWLIVSVSLLVGITITYILLMLFQYTFNKKK